MSGFWFENRSSDRRARGLPASAMCIQRFDDSLSPAIHTRYRISLRSSSLREPRYPLLRVVLDFDSGLRLSTDAAFRVIRIVPNRLNGLCVYIDTGRRLSTQPTLAPRLSFEKNKPGPAPPNTPAVKQRGARIHCVFARVGMDRVSMILPQVHLRKPCYDFSFL